MKKVLCLFLILFIVAYALTFSAFSFKVDGDDTGIEWDGASVYKLIDGESNCGVNFGVVKVKFDYDTQAVGLCFLFSDPGFSSDNQFAGISLELDGASPFEINASDGYLSENVSPYSFDGAIFIDDTNGATCEIRVGFKAGLPETLELDVRFIDFQGYYSNFYDLTIVNEAYVPETELIINPTADNTDPAYNPDYDEDYPQEKRTTKRRPVRASTTKRRTTKKSTTKTTRPVVEIKTSPPFIYTENTYTRYNKKTAKSTTQSNTTKIKDSENKTVVVYYEKEIYISNVYVTNSTEPTSLHSANTTQSENQILSTDILTSDSTGIMTTEETITLSEGTKYKKVISVLGIVAFLIIAFFGTYSAKKNSNKLTDK